MKDFSSLFARFMPFRLHFHSELELWLIPRTACILYTVTSYAMIFLVVVEVTQALRIIYLKYVDCWLLLFILCYKRAYDHVKELKLFDHPLALVVHLFVWCGGFIVAKSPLSYYLHSAVIFAEKLYALASTLYLSVQKVYIFLMWIFWKCSRICVIAVHWTETTLVNEEKAGATDRHFLLMLSVYFVIFGYSALRLLLPLASYMLLVCIFLIAFISFPPRYDLWRYQIFIGLV